ncbi:hypothetical protein LOY67_17510 [Pseudomonas sp. B21-056]|jgi:hypothetical protein|uniref:hypothetical protein n=1 Tax=Pseudomonas sp. B21-056 TaxID=2895495 RepID=UPI00222F8438|nr:hypothetical protein [Pseudomonas sp. B21-056]UZE21844.1 hypothetical protein LOY67_17510 [Pseudomonas sp. B21-056]
MDDFDGSHLKKYLNSADETSTEILAAKPGILLLAGECVELIQGLIQSCEINLAARSLAANSLFVYLAGIRIALSGHPAAVSIPLRTSLESACYALLVVRNESLVNTWLCRHRSEKDLKAQKKAFAAAVPTAAAFIEKIDSDAAMLIKALYEAAIDFGGHPNPRAMQGHVMVNESNDELIDFGCLYGWGTYTGGSLTQCVEFGIAIAVLLAATVEDHPLFRPSSTVLGELMRRKNEFAEQINGSPIQYGEDMYNKLDPVWKPLFKPD